MKQTRSVLAKNVMLRMAPELHAALVAQAAKERRTLPAHIFYILDMSLGTVVSAVEQKPVVLVRAPAPLEIDKALNKLKFEDEDYTDEQLDMMAEDQ